MKTRITQLARAIYMGPVNPSIPAILEIDGVKFASVIPQMHWEEFAINQATQSLIDDYAKHKGL